MTNFVLSSDFQDSYQKSGSVSFCLFIFSIKVLFCYSSKS